MCFFNDDYDWTARDVIVTEVVSNGSQAFTCFDCNEAIPLGEPAKLTEMYEYESCPDCGCRHNDCDDCDEETKGEEFAEYQCATCLKFREAIHDMEVSEGCNGHEAEPQGSLSEEFGNMGDAGRVADYYRHAAEMFPDFAASIEDKYSAYLEDE